MAKLFTTHDRKLTQEFEHLDKIKSVGLTKVINTVIGGGGNSSDRTPLSRSLTINGAENQIAVDNSTQNLNFDRVWNLSLPQDIGTQSDVTFNSLDLTEKLEIGGGKEITDSDDILTVDSDGVIVSWWNPTLKIFRVYIDAGRPDDSGDGFTWETAKKTFAGAFSIVPENVNWVMFFVHGGVYNEPFYPNFSNKKIQFYWCGLTTNTNTDVISVAIRGESVDPIRNNDPIVIEGTADMTVTRLANFAGVNAQYELLARDHQTGKQYSERWVFRWPNNPVTGIGLINFGENASLLFNCHVRFDMGNMYSGIETSSYADYVIFRYGLSVYGGAGQGSTVESSWRAAILLYGKLEFGGHVITSSSFEVGYALPQNALVYLQDIKQFIAMGGPSSPRITSYLKAYSNADIIPYFYADVDKTYGKSIIRASTQFAGTIEYDSRYIIINDLSLITPRAYLDVYTDTLTSYSGKTLLENSDGIKWGTGNSISSSSALELIANKVTSLSSGSTDIQYPSAKLVFDQLALKAPIENPTFTGTLTAPTVNATTALQINGTDINTTGTLSNVAYKGQANNFGAFTQTASVFNSTSAIQLNGTDINTTGTLSNVAYKGQNNNFTTSQTIAGSLLFSNSGSVRYILGTTESGSDDGAIAIAPNGGTLSAARGAYFALSGANRTTNAGNVYLTTASNAGAKLEIAHKGVTRFLIDDDDDTDITGNIIIDGGSKIKGSILNNFITNNSSISISSLFYSGRMMKNLTQNSNGYFNTQRWARNDWPGIQTFSFPFTDTPFGTEQVTRATLDSGTGLYCRLYPYKTNSTGDIPASERTTIFSISFWMRADVPMTVSFKKFDPITKIQTTIKSLSVTTSWQRFTIENFDCSTTTEGNNTGFYLTTNGLTVGNWYELTGCQLEYGPVCTAYQKTDETLLSSDKNGVYSENAYFGNTPQSPSVSIENSSVTAPTLNGTSAIQLNGTSINTTGTLSNVVYKEQDNKFKVGQSITGTLDVTGNIKASGTVTGTVITGTDHIAGSANYFYFGAEGTDGSWRIGRSGNNLVFERRESGSWVTKSTITP